MTLPIVNIAAYKFFKLDSLPDLRAELKQRCTALGLKGTILLSPEGINLALAGSHESIHALLTFARAIPGCENLEHKESFSLVAPFHKIKVKIKKQIIAFGVEGIEPAKYTSRKLDAEQLKQWLDAGKEVVLLDTRNDYEIEAGTFEKAVTLPLDDFRNFPKRMEELREQLKNRPIVTFCTGGIRCEKAAPYLEQAGYKDVYQLDGGILKYFERCGPAHYKGRCYVFDQREALDAELRPMIDAV
jgi:UPF0176 protein